MNSRSSNAPEIRHPSFDHEKLEIIFSLLAVFLILVFGILGYETLEGWDFLDSLYMTVITLSTVGFQEIHPLSPSGRIFTIVLILLGVGTAAMVLTTVARKIFERQILWVVGRRRMEQTIAALHDHTIFCGFGRLSRIAAVDLRTSRLPIVVIEREDQPLQLAQDAGFLTVKGDATRDEVLLAAGIKRASRLVSLLPKDADNLYIILTARELNPDIYVISRAEEELGEKRMRQAGADNIIAPYRVSGQKIANSLIRPYVSDFLDLAATGSNLAIEELKIPPLSPLCGKTLGEVELRQRTNVMIAAIIPAVGEMKFNPSGDTVLEPGAIMIGLGRKEDFHALEQLLVGP